MPICLRKRVFLKLSWAFDMIVHPSEFEVYLFIDTLLELELGVPSHLSEFHRVLRGVECILRGTINISFILLVILIAVIFFILDPLGNLRFRGAFKFSSNLRPSWILGTHGSSRT
jgi:hypothetical protein